MKCKTCRFYKPLVDKEGLCRRFPPGVSFKDEAGNVGMYPTTYDSEWCGEWKSKRDFDLEAEDEEEVE